MNKRKSKTERNENEWNKQRSQTIEEEWTKKN